MMLEFLKTSRRECDGHFMIKLGGLLKVPARWFYTLVTDQTKIDICGKHSDNTPKKTLFVENDSTDMGVLVFGIATRSRHSIEILKIAIDYSPPLQLLDPKKMGFFQAGCSSDESFPFRLLSEQGFQLHSMLMHVFALIAQFPPGVRELPVRISVYARTLRVSVSGFESVGRTQITRNLYRVVLADNRLLGMQVPPKHSLTTIQPFLIQAGLTASGYGVGSSALVHEKFNDDAVSS
jgi:hypothetical protein